MLGGFRKALTPCGDKRAQHVEEKLLLFLARIQPMKHYGLFFLFFHHSPSSFFSLPIKPLHPPFHCLDSCHVTDPELQFSGGPE